MTHPEQWLPDMKHVVILLAFASGATLAESATCDVHTAAELRTVFAVAAGLNDAFRRTSSGTPEHAKLRTTLTDYDERRTLPCASAAAELLGTSPNALLGRSLLELVSSSVHSDSPSLVQSLGRFLDSRPDDFLNALARMPLADRCALVELVESGWADLKSANASTMPTTRTPAGDDLVANMKRAYCRVTIPKPAVKSPGNRARDESEVERRESRTRLARAAPGDSMTSVAALPDISEWSSPPRGSES